MNERIQKLAKQAGFGVYGEIYSPNDEDSPITKNIEKFAELIVKECIGCCEQVISDPVPESVDTWLNGGEQCIQEIKQHFGIRE